MSIDSYNTDYELSKIDKMSGHDFEKYCAVLLQENGFTDVVVTQGSGDNGVDIVAIKDNQRWAFQCKRYNSDLGNKPVQEVYTGMKIYKCTNGVVITNRFFTDGAIKTANATGVMLWSRKHIKQLIENKRWFKYANDNLWPHNRNTDRINYDYYNSLPPVNLEPGMQESVICYPIDGDAYNHVDPYGKDAEDWVNVRLVEIYTDVFKGKSEAEHFLNAIIKRYYARSTYGVRQSSNGRFSVAAYIQADRIKHRFDKIGCYWILENLA